MSKHLRGKSVVCARHITVQYRLLEDFQLFGLVFCNRKWVVSLEVLVKKSSDFRLLEYQRFITPTKLRKSTEEENSDAVAA